MKRVLYFSRCVCEHAYNRSLGTFLLSLSRDLFLFHRQNLDAPDQISDKMALGVFISQDLKISVKFLYIVVKVFKRYWILVAGYWIRQRIWFSSPSRIQHQASSIASHQAMAWFIGIHSSV